MNYVPNTANQQKYLEPYLPKPIVVQNSEGRFSLDSDRPLSIGRVRAFYSNFSVLVKAYA